MKKSVLLVVALVCALGFASVSQGAITLNFATGTNALITHLGGLLPAASLFTVYYSPDQNNNGFVPTPTGVFAPVGGDIFLAALSTQETGFPARNGRISGHGAETFGGGTTNYAGGYVYIAAFEYPYATYQGNPGTVPAGTYYGVGPAVGPATQQFPDPATIDDYGANLTPASPITTNQQIVPEPTTMALFGLGIVVIALRKLRK
jgi:hypothetical protein